MQVYTSVEAVDEPMSVQVEVTEKGGPAVLMRRRAPNFHGGLPSGKHTKSY